MKSIKKTVTTAQLNTGAAQKITIYIPSNENGLEEYPNEVLFVNNTTTDIEVLYIQTDEEDTLRTNNPQFFDFIPLDSGRGTGLVPHLCKYLYVRRKSGSAAATVDLDFYLLSYIPRY